MSDNQITFEGFEVLRGDAFTALYLPVQGDIAELLEVGIGHAVKGKALADSLGIDIRTATDMIRKERLSGQVICGSTRAGFFLPTCAEDIQRTARSLESRGKKCLEAAASLRRAADVLSAKRE